VQSEHVSDPAEPGLRSARRGGSTLFQKGGPNILREYRILMKTTTATPPRQSAANPPARPVPACPRCSRTGAPNPATAAALRAAAAGKTSRFSSIKAIGVTPTICK